MASICTFDEEPSSSTTQEEMKINEKGLELISWLIIYSDTTLKNG